MEYSLIVYSSRSNDVIFESGLWKDTKENMRHLGQLYDDFENDGFICRWREHMESKNVYI